MPQRIETPIERGSRRDAAFQMPHKFGTTAIAKIIALSSPAGTCPAK